MKISKSDTIAYAMAFVSFIFPKIDGVKEIILFGSGSRGELSRESDIDLFFDIEGDNEDNLKELIDKEISKFYRSKIGEVWSLKEIKNPIKVNFGKLDEWKLKRSIISDGISLYSKYKEVPKNMNAYSQFVIEPIKNISKRNKIIRELFGRKEKKFNTEGILKKYLGKKLSATSFIVPLEHSHEIIHLLGKEKVSYTVFEFWTDKV